MSIGLDGIDLHTLRGRDVLLVEDIVDTGLSMSKLIPRLMEYSPKSVKVWCCRCSVCRRPWRLARQRACCAVAWQVCTFLEKRTARSCGFKAHYVGFSVPDLFVIGYNMDYNEAFRELPHVCVINEVGIRKYKQQPFLLPDDA